MFHFTCDTCDFRLDIDFVPRVYVLPDSRSFPMMQRHIWCHHCQHIRVAEALCEHPDDYAARLERRESHRKSLKTSNYVSGLTKEMQQKIVPDLCRKWIEESEELDRIIAEWQRLRTAGQSCLCCGNSDILVPEHWWVDLDHVPCFGTLHCTATVFGGTFTDRRLPHQYDVNGQLLQHGRMSDCDDAEEIYLWWPGT